MGKSSSATSADKLAQLPSGSWVTFMPSWSGVPPHPPAGKSENTKFSPLLGSFTEHTNQLHSAKVGATARSGIASESAFQIAAVIFEDVSVVQPIVGEGHFALSQLRSGSRISIGRKLPALAGASGERKNLSE